MARGKNISNPIEHFREGGLSNKSNVIERLTTKRECGGQLFPLMFICDEETDSIHGCSQRGCVPAHGEWFSLDDEDAEHLKTVEECNDT